MDSPNLRLKTLKTKLFEWHLTMNSFPLNVTLSSDEANSTTDVLPSAMILHGGKVRESQVFAHDTTDRKCASTDAPPRAAADAKKPSPVAKKPSRKRKWKKPKDMPKRPLSAYNLFFAHERQEMLKLGSLQSASSDSDLSIGVAKTTMGFAGLARTIAAKWKSLGLEVRSRYEEQAEKEQARYKREVNEWKRIQEERKNRDQQFQAQLAAASQMGLTSSNCIARYEAPRSPSDSFLEVPQNRHRMLSGLASNLGNANTVPLWPAMPQTIASLGNIYDASVRQEMGQQSIDSSRELSSSSLQPNGPLQQSLQGELGRMETITPRSSLAGQPHAMDTAAFPQLRICVNANGNANATNVASPDRITNLVAQLDDESFDFLSSLKDSDPDQTRE